jgi:hypothetical protein
MPLAVRFEPSLGYGVTLRIKPGVTIADANADLQPIMQQFAKENPGRYPDAFRVNLRSIVEMYARPMGPKLLLVLGAVASLLSSAVPTFRFCCSCAAPIAGRGRSCGNS